MLRASIILLFVCSVVAGQSNNTTQTYVNGEGGLSVRTKINEDIDKGNAQHDSLQVHLDSLQAIRVDINASGGSASVDTTDALRADINTNTGNITSNSDSITAHRTDLDALFDSIAVHLDTIQVYRIDINGNIDTLAVHRTDINRILDSLGIHLDTLQQLRIDILNNSDSLVVHRTDINNNIDSLGVHLDSLQAHRVDINDNTDSIEAKIALDEPERLDFEIKEFGLEATDTVVIKDLDGSVLKVTVADFQYVLTNALTDLIHEVDALGDSIDALRLSISAVDLKSEYDSLRINDAKDSFNLWLTDSTGQYRATLDVDSIEDDILPIPVSMVIANGNPDEIDITFSEYMEDSTELGTSWVGVDRWWSLNEASGILEDSVSADNATNTGAAYGATGKVGDAMDFESDDPDYLTMGTGFNYVDQDFTVTAWVNPESLAADRAVMGGITGAFFFEVNSDGTLTAGSNNVSESTKTALTVSTGSLQFIGVSYDQSANELEFHVDGSNETESFTHEFSAVTNIIGGRTSSTFNFDGIIDEVNAWDHVLTSEEWAILAAGAAYADGLGNQDSIINAFTINVTPSGSQIVEAVSILNDHVFLDLDGDITYNDTVTVTYNKPVTNGLRDTANNEVESFADFPVTNNIDTSENFTIYEDWNFSGEQVGDGVTSGGWSNAEAAAFFQNGTRFLTTHTTAGDTVPYIVEDTINGAAVNVLRIKHHANQLQSGIEIMPLLTTNFPELYLSYNWKFGENMNSNAGGKLSGFWSANGGDNPINSIPFLPHNNFMWASSMLFKRAGAVSTYHYDWTNGGSVPWATDTDSVLFNYGQWYNITERIKVNTFTSGVSNADGLMEIWINGEILYQETGLSTHNVEADTNQVNALWIANFYGGGSPSYVPTTECFGYIANIKVFKMENDPTWGTIDLHTDTIFTPDRINDRDFFYKELIDNDATDMETTSYPGSLPVHSNEMWLMDAGAGNTVQIDITAGRQGGGDYLVAYDGNTSDAEEITRVVGYDNDLSDNDFGSGTSGRIVSTGRYLFIKLITDNDSAFARLTANVTFNL